MSERDKTVAANIRLVGENRRLAGENSELRRKVVELEAIERRRVETVAHERQQHRMAIGRAADDAAKKGVPAAEALRRVRSLAEGWVAAPSAASAHFGRALLEQLAGKGGK